MPDSRHAIGLRHVFAADLIVGAACSTGIILALGPNWVAETLGASDVVQWAALGAGLLLVAGALSLLWVVRSWILRKLAWLNGAYAYAKQERGLSFDWERLSAVEKAFAGSFACVPIFALIVPIVPLFRYAYETFAWMHSIIGAVFQLVPILVGGPLLFSLMRLSMCAGVKVAARIAGGPAR